MGKCTITLKLSGDAWILGESVVLTNTLSVPSTAAQGLERRAGRWRFGEAKNILCSSYGGFLE